MTKWISTRPDTPPWAERINEHAVKCRTCTCTYTDQHEFWWGEAIGATVVGGIPDTCTVCKREAAEKARRALPMRPAVVAAVRRHAQANYENGWDIVVEAWTDDDIWAEIAGTASISEAIHKMGLIVGLLKERRDEVCSTIW